MTSALLLVEDDATFGAVLARSLGRRGFDVTWVRSSEEALAIAPELRPPFAVVDLKLPRDSGLAVVAALKRELPATRTVVLTGFASVATAVEAIKLGAVHYLAKPADADQVIEALTREKGNPAVPVTEPPSLARLEWEHIQQVLTRHDGNISAAARALKMHRRSLQRKLAKRPVRS
jgi:two-component system response regulator RegA